jgi:transcriptional regulator with XRE-family HTH domain
MSIRYRVVAAAHQAGIRLAEVARRLGVRAPTLHGGLRNDSPTYKHLPQIADMCGVSVEWLRSGEPGAQPVWWAGYIEAAEPEDAAAAGSRSAAGSGGPAHLLERIRRLEAEKTLLQHERDDARAALARLEQEAADLARTVTHQAVRLAKLHQAADAAAQSGLVG